MGVTRIARTVSVSIELPLAEVYAFVSRPENLPSWAAGLTTSLRETEDGWLGESPAGPITVQFSAPNAFGVLDHIVTPTSGEQVYVPMRAVANGDGAEVMLTVFREPDWTDERFASDLAAVQHDLDALKRLLAG
jgi:hypothetical protein